MTEEGLPPSTLAREAVATDAHVVQMLKFAAKF